MTPEEARKLEVGDWVTGFPNVRGVVLAIAAPNVIIEWEKEGKGVHPINSPGIKRVGPPKLGEVWLRPDSTRRVGRRRRQGRRGRGDGRR
jgi:hypothetical protein